MDIQEKRRRQLTVEAKSTSVCDLQILEIHCAATRRMERFNDFALSPPSSSTFSTHK